ncbi:DUF1566 domain-containing protein [Aestuariibacter salexigens]|uniref:Lcl C-terminal domain-containing protein n=1 Tax=Aestuariibacter salexigens TaxID=226010 RepID=UPI000425C641|nr:DUF1566 domain-containing protein [Aestuariibacter salexigens]
MQSRPRYALTKVIWLTLLLSLAACGGGSSESDDNSNTPLILVNVGSDIIANEQTTVSLSASARGQSETLSYSWQATPSLTITHPDSNAAAATVSLPETTQTLEYALTLTVTDSDGNSGSDTLNLTVRPVNALPEASISFAQLDSYPDYIVPAGAAITLDGSASDDSDPPSSNEAISQWSWQQLAGPDVLDGVDVDGPILNIVAPVQPDQSQIQLQLTITDQEGGQATAELGLIVQDAQSTVPTVNAGRAQQVYPGEMIMLIGEADSTVAAAKPLAYQWQASTTQAVITDPTALQTFAVFGADAIGQTVRFTLDVTDLNGNTVEDTVDVIISEAPRYRLNDTGVTLQATNSQNTASFVPELPGQDAHLGQDVIATYGNFEKAGRGDAGFDFTRLNANGDEVDSLDEPFSCVRDNITGLVWEVKSDDGGLHDKDHTYSWYFEDNNGGFDGDLNGAGSSCSLTQCNTQAFVDAVNVEGLCGFFDWRVPSHDELSSILHYGLVSTPMVDDEYFPSQFDTVTGPLWFWTRIASADGVNSDNSQNAWALDFASGVDNFLNKSSATRVRLVRAGR